MIEFSTRHFYKFAVFDFLLFLYMTSKIYAMRIKWLTASDTMWLIKGCI